MMRITILGPVHLTDVEYEDSYAFPSDDSIEKPRRLKKVNDFSMEEPDFITYMDPDFAEIGLMGALITLQYYPEMKSLFAHTHYWAPRKLSDQEVKLLLKDTAGQWSDGIGENGIQIEHEGQSYFLLGTSLIGVEDGE